MQLALPPMTLTRRAQPFSHPDWLFEIKHDGFRALAYLKVGRCQLVSREGYVYKRFGELTEQIGASVNVQSAVLDGEIVSLDKRGKSQFKSLMYRGEAYFYVFDMLQLNGRDLRSLQLHARKREVGLHRLVFAEKSRSGYRLAGWECSQRFSDHHRLCATMHWLRQADLDPEDLVQVGLTLKFQGGEYFISAVATQNGKPTVDGVRVGDKLIRVDGLNTKGATRGTLFSAMHGDRVTSARSSLNAMASLIVKAKVTLFFISQHENGGRRHPDWQRGVNRFCTDCRAPRIKFGESRAVQENN